jgi:uncharacterized membrane protein YccC
VHEDGDVLADDFLGERDESLSDATQDDARIGSRVDTVELEDEQRRLGEPGSHRRAKELLLRARVAQDSSGRYAQLASDVCQRRRIEALGCEHAPCRFQQLLPGNSCRPAHL